MIAVGGPFGLLVTVIWPNMAWYFRRMARLVSWSFPYTTTAAWFSVRWLAWGFGLAVAWFLWTVEIAIRLCFDTA